MLFETVLSCLLVVFVWIYYRGQHSGRKYPKGPWGVPIFGHLPFIGALPTETFRKWSEKYGNVFMIRLGKWNTVVVNGEQAIREIGMRKDAFSGKPPFGFQLLLREAYGGEESLSFTNFDASYIHHRKLTKMGLQTYMHEHENELQDLIFEESVKLMEEVVNNKQDAKDMYKEFGNLIANILFQILYGRGKDASKSQKIKAMWNAHDGFVESLKSGNIVDVLPWVKYILPSAVYKLRKMLEIYHSIWKANVNEHNKTYDGTNLRDLADIFIATKLDNAKNKDANVSRERLMYTLIDLFAAGMDTSLATLRWLFLYMIEFPEVQRRVFEELNDTIGQARVMLTDRSKLPYTEATLREVLRIRAASPLGVPHYTTEDTHLDKLYIDKDTVVMINFQSVSHDRDFWGDPQNFRPERYMLDNGELDPVKMKYEVTFGVGRRKCIGEDLAKRQLFLIFTTLIQRYEFSKAKGDVLDFTPVAGLTYLPKPYRIVVQERLYTIPNIGTGMSINTYVIVYL